MKKIAIVVASVFLITGCATTGQTGGKATSQQHNAVGGAALGALAGCGIAVLLGAKCAEGAVVGAAIGAVAGWSYESKQVASAEEINSQARHAGIKVPSNKVVLQSYDVTSNTRTIQPGGVVVSESNIKLMGHSDRPIKVEERLSLVNPEGKEGAPQVGKLTADGAGQYSSTGKFTIPKAFPQGKYAIKSELLLDDKVASHKAFNVQVAYVEGKQIIHLAVAD